MHTLCRKRFCCFFLILSSVLLSICPSATAAPDAAAAEEKPVVTATVSPTARLQIISTVAMLPAVTENDKVDNLLTNTLYQAVLEIQKYRMVPMESGNQWFEEHFSDGSALFPEENATRAGADLEADGVLVARIRHGYHPGRLLLDNRPPVTACTLSLIRTGNGEVLWNLTMILPETVPGAPVPGLNALVEQAMTVLKKALVDKGDIFSPLLPRPEVLSSQGAIRSARVVLQPDPPHIFTAYQLLRADSADGVFTAVGSPTPNEAPVILTDKGLKDGSTYYYTVIGLTADGFANIPAPPFRIETKGPPPPVGDLRADSGRLRHVRLSWTPSLDPTVDGYLIFRSLHPNGPFEQIAEIDGRERQLYVDKGQATGFSRYGKLSDSTEYFYTIRTRNIVGVQSEDSPVVSAVTKGAPLPPTNLQAIDRQPKKLPLAWTAAPDPEVTGYAVYRASSPDGPFVQIDYVSGRESQQYVDTGSWNHPLENDTTYWYRIRSVNVVDVQSEPSTTVHATTKAPPARITGVSAVSGLFRRIDLTWNPGPEADIRAYEIFRGGIAANISTKIKSLPPDQTTYTDSSLADARTYWYQVRAVDVDGLAGQRSEPVHATTKHPPRQPVGLKGSLIRDEIRLRWQANPEKDIDHYEVGTGGFLGNIIGTPKQTSFTLKVEIEETGQEMSFQVRAVDSDGLKSEYSMPVRISIPKQ